MNDLPTLFHAYPLGYRFVPRAINASGQVVGDDESTLKAFVTGADGKGVTLFGPEGRKTEAKGINASGQVVGSFYSLELSSQAFITNGKAEQLRVLEMPVESYRWAYVHGINDAGQVAGYYVIQPLSFGSSTFAGFITAPDGGKARAIYGFNPEATTLSAINNSGQVTGESQFNQATSSTEFITGPNGSGLTVIDPSGAGLVTIRALNDRGQFGGSALFPPGKHAGNTTNPFIAVAGQPIEIKRNLGGIYGELLALNSQGDHVGYSTEPTGGSRAYVSVQHGRPVRLDKFVSGLPQGVRLTSAHAINDRRQIAAVGSDDMGYIVCPKPDCE